MTLAYDAENRVVAVCTQDTPATCQNQPGAGRTLYVYDGLGNRVQKQDSNGNAMATYVYDAFGNLAAEYGGSTTASGTQYVTADALGSTRLVASGSSPTERHDFEPFGYEVAPGGTWRATVAGYGADTVRQKFTGQERDSESSLDFFSARYFDGIQGRFTSPDPDMAGANLGDPQSWNAYAYVSNSPLSYVDPSGLGFWSWLFDAAKFASKIAFDILTLGFGGPLVDGVQIGGSIAGGLGDCGGPLGNCGTLGSDPWSENPGLARVQDPGGFIFDYNSIYHGVMTLGAGGSPGLAWGVVWADFRHGSQGTDPTHTHMHAMGGTRSRPNTLGSPRYESCGQAYAGTVAQLSAARGDPSLAIHTIQDSYSDSHSYLTWSGSLTIDHEVGDFSLTHVEDATHATERYIQALNGKAPMGPPESYLAPRPASCK